MRMHIDEIILWPKNRTKKRRQFHFEPGKINVITGSSKRGKSALLMILDYCMGSRKCLIPVGLIREKTDWFGVKITIGSTKLILGRKEPGQKAQTGEMFRGRMSLSPSIQQAIAMMRMCEIDWIKRLGCQI